MAGEGKRRGGVPDFATLQLLLDGYFHQDFRMEYGNHEGAARVFSADASPEERMEAGAALAAFLAWAEGVTRAEWQAALSRAGGAWRPRSLGPIREVAAIVTPPP